MTLQFYQIILLNHKTKGVILIVKTRIIIFSSKESLYLAQAIQNNFYYEHYTVNIWSHSFFELSKPYIFNFEKLGNEYDYAILLCTQDDLICLSKSQHGESCSEKVKFTSRDNIWLELGMCISKLSLKKTIIVKDKSVNLPSDLAGIEPIHFEYPTSINEQINIVASQITSRITSYIENSSSKIMRLSWEEYFMAFRKMLDKILADPDYGGYIFDVIVGISGGGLMVGDLLSREIKNHTVPVLPLYADRRTKITKFDTKISIVSNNDIVTLLNNQEIKNILLVDSFTRNGLTINEAYKFLVSKVNNKTIKTAVIYVNETLRNTTDFFPDYIGEEIQLENRKLMLESSYIF